MEIYEFEKTLLTRLKESKGVLCWKNDTIPATRVRAEWAYFVEVQIEPTGWHALWKVPRVICEDLHIKFPTIVFGIVENVLFKELKAIFTVLAVEDDDVQLPEQQEVSLEDLWPTKTQENGALNVERTADCIDQLRFFYNNVWMPWDYDNDDDLDWADKHLESRIRFHYELKRKDMKRSVAAYIKALLSEARYIQNRREYLEIGLSDDDELDDTLDKTQITDLMRMHLRLTIIKSEIELLENPEMRKVYEEVKFCDAELEDETKSISNEKSQDYNAYIVTKPNTIQEHIKLLKLAENFIGGEGKNVHMCPTLQDALNTCKSHDDILLTPGCHSLKYLEYFNNNGRILGLTMEGNSSVESAIITSQDDDSTLLVFDGDSELQNITLDCKNVRTGVLVKNGTICLKNCYINGDEKSSTKQGIVAAGSSKIIIDSCKFKNFASGIVLKENAQLELNVSTLVGCKIGIEMRDSSFVIFNNSSISSTTIGVWFETKSLSNRVENRKLVYENLSAVKENYCGDVPWSGDPNFVDNKQGNVVVLNMKLSQFPFSVCDLGDSSCSINELSSIFDKCDYSDCETMVDNSCIVINDSMDEVFS